MTEKILKPKPRGVRILAALHILGGALTLPLLLTFGQGLGQAVGIIGASPILVFVSLGFLGLLALASGIGMWTGKRWGWWLAVFYYVYGALGNANTILTLPGILDQLGTPAQGAGFYYARELGQAFLSILLILYLYRRNVRGYFGLGSFSIMKSGAVLIGSSLAVILATTLFSSFLPSSGRDLDAIATIYQQGDVQTAVDKLKQYLESNPRDPLAWTILGNAHLDLDAAEEAKTAYQKAIEINPRQFQALSGLGLVASRRGNYDQAVSYYQKAVQANPQYAPAYSNMAIAAIKQGQDARALEYAKQAYALDKNDPVIVANLAIMYHYNGAYEQRDKMTEEAKRLGYPNIEALQKIYKGLMTIRD